jgi:hypothetical protein
MEFGSGCPTGSKLCLDAGLSANTKPVDLPVKLHKIQVNCDRYICLFVASNFLWLKISGSPTEYTEMPDPLKLTQD